MTEPHSGRARVLAVDDDPDLLLLLRSTVEGDGHQAILASDGRMALQRIEDETPDVICLDLMMPVMDGATTLGRLRSNPRTAQIPVVFMTARAQSRELDLFRSLGAVGVIPKPFDPMALAVSCDPAGDVDLEAYERLLPKVTVAP